MKKIQVDDHGNFVFDGDLEMEWMKLHRDIQAEYRNEQWLAFLKGLACVAAVVTGFYFVLTGFNHWFY